MAFTINPIEVESAEVNITAETYVYDGNEKAPEITVTLEDGTILVQDVDYVVSYYIDNVNAGTVEVYIDFNGNYTGEIIEAGKFEIQPVNISDMSDLKISLSEDSFTFDGKAKTPAVTVTLPDGTVLT